MSEAIGSEETDAAGAERPSGPAIGVPPEGSGARRGTRIGSRMTWLVLFTLPAAVMITALMLTPDPAGHGTHTQLGLPPCGFLIVSGYPCPGCGLTTSFAHMIRLEIVGAALANPFGILLFLVSFAMIPLAALGFIRGWPVVDTLDRLHFEKWAVLLAATSVLTWVVRIGMNFARG